MVQKFATKKKIIIIKKIKIYIYKLKIKKLTFGYLFHVYFPQNIPSTRFLDNRGD